MGFAGTKFAHWPSHDISFTVGRSSFGKLSAKVGGDKSDNKGGRSDDLPADLIRVRAEIEFNTDPVALSNLLSEIANAEHQVVVESLNVKLPRTTMTVTSWHKLQPIASAADGHAGSAASSGNVK